MFHCYEIPYWPNAILQKILLFEGLNKSREESTGYYWDNKPSLIELCKQRLLLYQSLEANSRKKNCQRTFFCIQAFLYKEELKSYYSFLD